MIALVAEARAVGLRVGGSSTLESQHKTKALEADNETYGRHNNIINQTKTRFTNLRLRAFSSTTIFLKLWIICFGFLGGS